MESTPSQKIIGIVSKSDPINDRFAWSGIIYKVRESIENAGYTVKWIKVQPNKYISLVLKFYFKLIGQKYWEFSAVYRSLSAKSININDINKCDYLFFPGEAQMLKYLRKRSDNLPPAIYLSDACFPQMIDYYWFGVPKWIVREGDELERIATDLSTFVIKTSNWAADYAINNYGCPKEKIAVMEFGANIDEKDIVTTEPYKGGELRVLFSGVDWKRKGCDIAIDCVRKLNDDGFNAKLYLVGLNEEQIPSTYRNLDFVEYVGFLNKNNSTQYHKYIEVISNCHCLLLPTHAECAGIVFSEASAFGLPSFAYDTGGISNYVINGKNGYRLSPDSTAVDFAHAIESAINTNEFKQLHDGALSHYKEKVSWKAWSKRFSGF